MSQSHPPPGGCGLKFKLLLHMVALVMSPSACFEVEKNLESDPDDLFELMSRHKEIIDRIEEIKISKYAAESIDEFIAESFTQMRIGKHKSPYAQKTGELIDSVFKKNAVSVDKSGGSGIIEDRKPLKINMQFFAEKDIENQESNSLKRAMRKYQKRIEEHNDKINNPEKYIPDWNNYDERKRQGLKKHWQKEISNFEESIENRIRELKKRGDYNE